MKPFEYSVDTIPINKRSVYQKANALLAKCSTINPYAITGELGFNPPELKFMSQYMFQEELVQKWKATDFTQYLNYLVKLRKSLKLHNVSNLACHFESSTSSFTQAEFESNLFQYSYQRYDLVHLNTDWLNKMYDIKNDAYDDTGFFVNSGMSAYLSALLTIKHLYSDINTVQIDQAGYHEIEDMLSHHLKCFHKRYFGMQSITQSDLLILDSSAPKLYFKHDWLNAKVIIVDTTCWEPGNCTLKKLINFLKNFQGIILLIRSHIKLDCFGLEVNRLGSIVLLSPKKNNIKVENLKKTCLWVIGNIGCNFSLDHYYPWLFKKEFQMLCKKRTEKIRFFTHITYHIIQNSIFGFQIIKSHHKLFMLARFEKKLPSTPGSKNPDEPVKKYARQMCAKGRQLGLAIAPSPSFGLCYTSIDGYRVISDAEEADYLRLSPSPNTSLLQIVQIAKFFIHYLTSQQNDA